MSPTQYNLEPAIVIVPYNVMWPEIYNTERTAIVAVTKDIFTAIEHIGSTSIPGLAAKPIIDMMAAVNDLDSARQQAEKLAALDYVDDHTDMPNRILFCKRAQELGYAVHFHVVTADTWDSRNERLLRDFLRCHPDALQAYGDLKRRLAAEYVQDGSGYTRAKTQFIQDVIDRARDERGLPRVNVWEA